MKSKHYANGMLKQAELELQTISFLSIRRKAFWKGVVWVLQELLAEDDNLS